MTVRMDVTNLVNYCKENNQSFFVNYLYFALRELNAISEFRMRVHDGDPYLYDKVDCSFTVANTFGYFVNRSVAFTDYSAFFGTDLEILLKGLHVDTLYLIGGLTDVCIHYTAVDAHQHDYHIRVVTDAVAGSSEDAHSYALKAIQYLQRDALITVSDIERAFTD